jgi:hypothetical protein
MIHLSFSLRDPFSDTHETLFYKGNKLTKNKSCEFQVVRTNEIVGLELSITIEEDHAGLDFDFALFGYGVLFNFYDTRHWDYDKDEWETYPSE